MNATRPSGDAAGMTPEEVTKKSFRTRFRGADQAEVSSHLDAVARTIGQLHRDLSAQQSEIDEQIQQIGELEGALRVAQSSFADLDDAELEKRLDDETKHLLEQSRAEAAEETARAESDSADILAQAEQIYAERSRMADEQTARVRSEMNVLREQRLSEIDQGVATARQAAEVEIATLAESADNERAEAEAEAHRLVNEAQIIRRQILEDLARRRSSARRQIEQLRAGRDRLVASHEVVRKTLAEVTEELTNSMTDARAAAETAGRAVSESTIEELEAEIETARLSGLLDTGPLPVVEPKKETDSKLPEPAASDQPKPKAKSKAADKPADKSAQAELSKPVEVSESRAGDDEAGPLAAVVDLDSARPDVDTKTHPSGGKATAEIPKQDSSKQGTPNQGGPTTDSPTSDEPSAGVSKAGAATFAAVADDNPKFEDEDLVVDDLFARMREGRTDATEETSDKSRKSKPSQKDDTKGLASAPIDKKEPVKTGKSAKKKQPLDLSGAAADISRQLKRVLADEQSAVLKKVRSAKSVPTVAELLGDDQAHKDTYWPVARKGAKDALEAIDGELGVDIESQRGAIDGLVTGLRDRVSKAVADNDVPDAVIEELRKVYRDVKTKRIGQHTEALCDALGDAATRDNATAD